jgi:nicotinamidase-related amidase
MFGFGEEKLELNAKETALVLIDLERGIVGRDLAPHSGTEVVQRCATLSNARRAAGGKVVFVHVLLHEMVRVPADKPMNKPGAPPPPPEMSELVPEAGYQAGVDVLVTKRQWDAFYGTDLKKQLDALGVKTIVLAGLVTNFGVESTARSAIAQGIGVVFAEDATSSFAKSLHTFAVENTFPVMGKVRSVKEIVETLAA